MIEVACERPICVELFRTSKALGRFALRSRGKTVAAGIITEVFE